MESSGPRDLVVVGASAGGVEVLRRLASGLPADLAACVLVVLHISPDSPSALAQILERAGPLPCRTAHDGDPLTPGQILVAAPDHHLSVEDGRARLSVGPRENGHRPSVDTLFRSAAMSREDHVVGVVLSGTRDDGSAGLALIKLAGGCAVVQDPKEAAYGGMPRSAIASTQVDAVVPSYELAATVVAMVNGSLPQALEPAFESEPGEPEPLSFPVAELLVAPVPGDSSSGAPFTTVCPECGGVLSEHAEAGVTQWGCRVGHRYSAASLIDAQALDVEAALWSAVRALEDRRMLLDRMASRFQAREEPGAARAMTHRATEAGAQAEAVRDTLRQAAASSLRELERDPDAAVEEAHAPAGGRRDGAAPRW